MTYQEFINNILSTRGRFICAEEYHERHHILPKCMGGNNDEKNLIDLYAREHFIAHQLLVEENPDNNKLIYALWRLSNADRKDRDYQLTPEEYEEARIKFADSHSQWRASDETKAKMSKAHKGYKWSLESRQRLSEQRKGIVFTPEHCANISKGRKGVGVGRIVSPETSRKISEAVPKTPVNCYSLDGEFIKSFESISAASRDLGVDDSRIVRVCKGKLKQTHGFMFTYRLTDNDENSAKYAKESRKNKPRRYSPPKAVVCDNIIYDSIRAFADTNGVNRSTARYWLNNDKIPLEFKKRGLSFYYAEEDE